MSIKTDSENIMKCNSMFQIARIIGKILRQITREYVFDGQVAESPYSSTFILGGQIRGDDPKLFLIYRKEISLRQLKINPFFKLEKLNMASQV